MSGRRPTKRRGGRVRPQEGRIDTNTVGGNSVVGFRRTSGSPNILHDNPSATGTGSEEHPPVDLPDSTLTAADRAFKYWLTTALNRGANGELPVDGVRVVFASGERWVLMRKENQILTKEGVPNLPLVSVSRGPISWGTGSSKRGWNPVGHVPLLKTTHRGETGIVGYSWVTMAPPIPFECSYTIDFWVREVRQLNDLMGIMMEAVRNRHSREIRIADPKTGWTFDVKFSDTFNAGDNLDDYTGAQRIVQSSIEATLWGRHLRTVGAKTKTFGSVNNVEFEAVVLEGSEVDERDRSVLPERSEGITSDQRQKSLLEDVDGASGFGDGSPVYERPKARLIDSRGGERIFRIVDDGKG